MKNFWFTFLALTFLFVSITDALVAQGFGEEACVITLKGQNRSRTVAGAVNKECGEGFHSAPWGNWGVDSNYGNRTDTDQFRGWKHLDGPSTKRQWNSCTTEKKGFRAPHYAYYNASSRTTQQSSAIVTHGKRYYRHSITPCVPPGMNPNPPPVYNGCSLVGGAFSQSNNYMTLYELDWPDNDDRIERLNFPGTSVTLTGCTYNGCPERTSGWVDMTGSSSAGADIEANLRVKVSATVEGNCSTWNW